MVDLAELQDRIRTHMYLQSIQPDDWFEDFDKLRSGRVTVDRFRRCFEFIRFRLTDAEFNALVQEYGDRGQVCYRRFLDTVEDVFSNKRLEKDPHATTVDSRDVVMRTQNHIDTSTARPFHALLSKLAHQVRTRGVHIRESFMDFDTHNYGRVSQTQFLRALPFRDLTPEEKQLLIKRYADPVLKDVNYKQFNQDVNEFIQSENPEYTATRGTMRLLPHHLASLRLKSQPNPSDEVLDRFATYVRERRVRIRDFFQSNDQLNLGIIPEQRFESTLTLFGFTFTDAELAYLVEKYKVIRDRTVYCNYREFCNAIDERADGTVTVPRERLIVSPDKLLESVLDRIRGEIQRQRMNVLPTLQGFDRMKRGFITPAQAHRALATLGIRISVPELNLLAKSYCQDEDEFDYFKLIEDIDPSHNQQRRSYRPLGTTVESIHDVYGHTPSGDRFVTPDVADEMIYKSKRGLFKHVNEHKEIKGLLTEMRRWAIVNGVMFQDFLMDFDKHKCGEIPVSQFRSGMSMSTYQLTEDEFDAIVDNYSSDTREGWIKWRKFADDVMTAVAPKELEKVPTQTPIHPREVVMQTTAFPDVSVVPQHILRIIEIIARFVKTRRISLMEQFKDKDRMNHRKVTATSFAQVLQLIGVHISKSEIDQLCTFYNDPMTNFVDYPLFVEEVERHVGLIFGDRAASSIVAKEIPKYGFENSEYLVQRMPNDEKERDWKEVRGKLQTFVFKRRIRLEDFFLSFDFHHMGWVTKQKFRSVCGQVNLPLTPTEIELCLQVFTMPEQEDLFNYREFCDQINEVFGVKELNRTPQDSGLARSTALPDPSMTLQRLCEADENDLQKILQRMRTVIATRRMNIREQFRDYDKHPRKNYISRQQFKQSIARLGLSTSPAEFAILCKKYRCTDLDDMNYQAFCNDVDPQDV